MLRYRVSESLSKDSFIAVGRASAQLIADTAQQAGVELGSGKRVLHFGCGCGRTAAWLIQFHPGIELHGADIDSAAIEWCRKQLRGTFTPNHSAPPLPYPAGAFDVVYCLSVFTHLNEEMQDAWLAELNRVLKPDGLLLLTVHGQNATEGLAQPDLETLQRVGFLHKKSRKLRGIVPEWYQTSWHTQEYVMRRLSRWCECINYSTSPERSQDIVAASRRA